MAGITMAPATGPAVANPAVATAPVIDWAAVIGGAVVATAIGAVFGAFGAGIGLSAISAEEGEGSGLLALILTGLWLVVTLVASYTAGGYVAGRMRRRADPANVDEVVARDGINGLVVWGVGIIIGAMVLGGAVSSTVTAAATVAGTATTAIGTAAGGADGLLPADPVAAIADTLTRPAQVDPASADTDDISRQVASIFASTLTSGEMTDADRAYLVSATAAQTGLPPAEVESRVDAAVAAVTEAEEAARDAAETARIGGVLTAFLLAAASLVAAAAAVAGAVKGGQHRDMGRMFGGFSYRV